MSRVVMLYIDENTNKGYNSLGESMDKKDELGKRLRYWRKARELTQEELAAKANITQKSVSAYENAKSFISFEAAKKISETLDISPLYLMGETNDPNEHKERKKHEDQFDINDIMPLSKPLPVYAWASCGQGTLVDETPIDYQTKPARSKGEFWVIAKGNSMKPKIQDGYLLLVTKDVSNLKNGNIVVLVYDDEIYCKYYSKQGESYIFTGEDKSYPPIVVNPGDANTQNFRIVGKVTALAISLE